MSKSAKAVTLVVAICAMPLVAVGLPGNERAMGDEPKDAETPAAPTRGQRSVGRDVPIQRQRIDDFIAQAGDYSDLEALISGLIDPVLNGDDIVFAAGLQTQDPAPQMQFAMVLADRRVARLTEMLSTLPHSDAEHLAEQAVDAKIRVQADGISAIIGDWRKNRNAVRPVPMHLNFHGSCAALFVCGTYCDMKTTVEKVDSWERSIGPLVDDVSSDPKLAQLRGEVTRYGRPERLYLLNLYIFLLERHGGLSADDVLGKVDFKIAGPKLFEERVPFCT